MTVDLLPYPSYYIPMNTEQNRLAFLIERDGLEGAVAFARRTRDIYRTHVLYMKRKHMRDGRAGYVRSYLALKQFVENNT